MVHRIHIDIRNIAEMHAHAFGGTAYTTNPNEAHFRHSFHQDAIGFMVRCMEGRFHDTATIIIASNLLMVLMALIFQNKHPY